MTIVKLTGKRLVTSKKWRVGFSRYTLVGSLDKEDEMTILKEMGQKKVSY